MARIISHRGFNVTGLEIIVPKNKEDAIKVNGYGILLGTLVPRESKGYIIVEAMGREIGFTNDKLKGAWELLAYATFPIPKLESV